jgi:hypothetical protein
MLLVVLFFVLINVNVPMSVSPWLVCGNFNLAQKRSFFQLILHGISRPFDL